MKRKTSVFDRQLKALVKLNKTKIGRDIIRENKQVFINALAEGLTK